jgi:hypothetical protein
MMYSLTLQGMKRLLTLTPMSMMTPTWILRRLPTLACVFRANAHHYVCSATADPDADTRPSHHGPRKVLEAPCDYDALRPRFAWLPTDIIKKTFEVITQYARMPLNTILRKHFKSPNPAVNVQ